MKPSSFDPLRRASLVSALFTLLLAAASGQGQSSFDKAEFAARRAKVFEKIGTSIAIVLANPRALYPLKFRQAPDFYYLTGIEEPDAVLLLDGTEKRATVYSPKTAGFRFLTEGPGLLELPDAAKRYGVDKIVQLDESFLSSVKQLARNGKVYAPISPPDELEYARSEMQMEEADQRSNAVLPEMPRYSRLVEMLRGVPVDLADVNPILDRLRWSKTSYEIERLRMSGRIAAEGVKEAIKGTKPGMYEYEIEAAAKFIFTKRGARGDAFTPIVASGPNTIILHYSRNNRQMKAGDIVYMDYGADYDYYTSDITRTWPVSGKFTVDEEKMYRCIFDARASIIAAMKPGVKVSDLQDAAGVVYKRYGFEKEFERFGRYVGHFIGISVHDVGDEEWPFVPGVVFNVEPLIQNDQKKIHLRLEDTVLITANGSENLTAGVPAALEEIYSLIRQPGLATAAR